MEVHNKSKIIHNLHFLCENSTNLSIVLINLLSGNVITENDCQYIQSFQTDYTRFGELYRNVLRKLNDNSVYEILLQSLQRGGNDHIVNQLSETDLAMNAQENYIKNFTLWFENRPTDNTGEPTYKGKEPNLDIFYNVCDPVESFTGRQSYLSGIHIALQENPKEEQQQMTVMSRTEILSGLGGIGKTELVRKYILHHKLDYDYFLWIDAFSYETASNCFKAAAKEQLRLELIGPGNIEKSFEFILTEVYSVLCTKKCLIVFDNADALDSDSIPHHTDHDMAGISNFLPKSLRPHHIPPCILVTSRNKDWGSHKTAILLNLLSQDESVTYTLEQLGIEDSDQTRSVAIKLTEVCSDFPLALQQAVSLIREESTVRSMLGEQYKIPDFIEEYRTPTSRRQFLQYTPKGSKGASVFARWNTTVQRIKKYEHGQMAFLILNFMAFLLPSNIPKRLVRILLPNENAGHIGKALLLLVKYSMIQDCTANGHFTIHKILQDIVIENLTGAGQQDQIQLANETLSISKDGVLSHVVKCLKIFLKGRDPTEELSDAIITNIEHLNSVHLTQCPHIDGISELLEDFKNIRLSIKA